MTPTLFGRWQTRLLLMVFAGGVVSLLFALLYSDATPLALLLWALVLGFVWDVLYQFLQSFRWDGDWPPLFYTLGCALEGVVLWLLIGSLPGVNPNLTPAQFIMHYSTVWLVVFIVMFGPLKVVFPRWRFHGGQWL